MLALHLQRYARACAAQSSDLLPLQFKGRGHEASDLRRLLEMYKRWQVGRAAGRACTLAALAAEARLPWHSNLCYVALMQHPARRRRCATPTVWHTSLPCPQDRIFPHGEFDAFIGNVERLSGTCALRHEVHELRMRLLRVRCGLRDAASIR